MDEKRLVIAAFGVVLSVVVGYIAYRFVAPLTVAVFLYYSTRRYYKALGRFPLPRRVRGVVVLGSLAIPLLLLISYTAVLLVIETRRFVTQYQVLDVVAENVGWFGGIERIPEFTVSAIWEAYQAGELDVFITFITENAAFLTTLLSEFFLNLFIVVVVTYYLLIDGGNIRRWLLRFDDEAIVREYLEAVDRELESVLFGNLLNVIATAIIAITVFHAYNVYVPGTVRVPYPTLAGALTGIASLVPVVGMKAVYVPVATVITIPVFLGNELALFVYVVAFIAVVFVVVDIVPDIVLRPLLSGETTHVGLLLLAYTLGPIVFGFYGLFLAPIILVVCMTFADTALPRLLGADPPAIRGIAAGSAALGPGSSDRPSPPGADPDPGSSGER